MIDAQKTATTSQSGAPVDASLRLSNVSVTYETSGTRLHAVNDVDLTVRRGEFVALIGPSGCGKSTILRAAAGLVTPTDGTITTSGAGPDGKANDFLMFQTPALLDWLSVERNVSMSVEVRGVKRSDALSQARAILEQVGLADYRTLHPYELSGGMQQRTALARALVTGPDLLLLDEPFGALDAITRDELCIELQRRWLESRMGVLLVTHSIHEAMFLADRILVMSRRPGRIIGEFTVPLDRPRALSDMSDPRVNEIEVQLLAALFEATDTAGAARGDLAKERR